MKNGFLFIFVADHQLVGQLYTNPKSDMILLSCLKVTQCSTSEIGDTPLYNSCLYRSKLWQQVPKNVKSGLARITGTCPGWWKQSFRLQLWSLVWFQVMATSCHLTSSKSAWKSTPKCTWMCWRVWCNQVASGRTWVWQKDSAPAHKSKETQAWLRKKCDDFVPFSHWPPPPPTWTRWTTSFGHTSRTSPIWPPTTPKPAWSPPSAEYSPSSRRRLWKRHAPSSASVSRRCLRLKAATLNRCQLYCIMKLPELIFSIKVLK